METNNCNTDLQVVSQEYPYEEESLQTKTKKLLKHLSPRDIWKLKSLIIGLLVACFLYVTYLTNHCRTWLSFTGRKRKERNAS